MLQFLLSDAGLIILGAICIFFGLSSANAPKTKAGLALLFIFCVLLRLYDGWLYVNTGKRVEDKIDCFVYGSQQKFCSDNQNSAPKKKIQPAYSIDPTRTVQPTDSRSSGPFNGWWAIGTPETPTDMASAARLWRWGQKSSGSCTYLKEYLARFPNAEKVGEARERLGRRMTMTVKVGEYFPMVLNTEAVSTTAKNVSAPEKICDAAANRISPLQWASCNIGASFRDSIIEETEHVVRYDRKVPNSCTCYPSPQSTDFTCNVQVESICLQRRTQNVEVERCT